MATASPPASSSSSLGSPPPRHHREQQQQQQPWQEPEPGSRGCSQLLPALPAPAAGHSPGPAAPGGTGHGELRELHCRGIPDKPGDDLKKPCLRFRERSSFLWSYTNSIMWTSSRGGIIR
uniref:rho GTPase-activating protein 17 n=1 Tax=Lonchura striata TaxID=40157 RepID=UPI000B4D9CF8|nr:rho GTPase-activating protein 17 [Lonchura striata domestica]